MDTNTTGEVIDAELVSGGLVRVTQPDTQRYGAGGLDRPTAGRWDRDEIRDAWLRAKRNRSRSDATVESYARDIDKFFAWCDANGLYVFRLLGPHIEAYIDWLTNVDKITRYKSKPRPRSAASIARMVSSVSSYYTYAGKHTNGEIWNPVDLADHRPKPEVTRETTWLTAEEARAVLDRARSEGLREYALIMLLLGTGIRVSEACNATTDDLDVVGGVPVLHIRGKGNKQRAVAMPPSVERALRRYVRDRAGNIFLLDSGDPMSRRMAAWCVERIARDALRIPPNSKRRITPHSLRRTAATFALDEGVNIRDLQVQLGHSRVETTMGYDKARRELKNSAVVKFAELVGED